MKHPHVITALALVACCLLASCGPQLLSRKELLAVLEDMYRTEVAISKRQAWEAMADTTQVYAAVFKKHKCTVEEFRYSLDYHLTRPDKIRPGLQRLKERLNAQREALDGVLAVDRQRFLRRDRYKAWLNDSLPEGPSRLTHKALQSLSIAPPQGGFAVELPAPAPDGTPFLLGRQGRSRLRPQTAPGEKPGSILVILADSLPPVKSESRPLVKTDSLRLLQPDSLPDNSSRGVRPRLLPGSPQVH